MNAMAEGTKLFISIDQHDFVIQVVGTRTFQDESTLPQTVILEHSKECGCKWAGAIDGHGKQVPFYVTIPADYKEPSTEWPSSQ